MDTNQNGWNNQNYNGQEMYRFETPVPAERNSMATASVVMGIITIISTIMCTVYVPFITGGLAVLFAILSKGNKKKLNSAAIAGTATGIVGLAMNILLIGTVWYMYMTVPEVHDQANDLFEQRYGYTIDEMLEELKR